jgi:phosphatidylglycerol:prolipoprotein diacylglycerol transferase
MGRSLFLISFRDHACDGLRFSPDEEFATNEPPSGAMHPILVTLWSGDPPLRIGTYGLMLLFACVAAALLLVRLARELGVSRTAATEYAVAAVAAGMLGAKVLGVLVAFLSAEHAGSWRAAGIVHGGIFGGLIAAWWISRRHAIPLLRVLDLAAAPVALGQGIGRLGCFLAGCCYGRPASGSFAVTFDSATAHALTHVPLGVPLFPVQLVDAAAHLVLVLLIAWPPARMARAAAGKTFAAWLVAEGILRIVLESFRGDLDRGGLTPFWSTGRITSAVLVTTALLLLLVARRAARTSDAAGRARATYPDARR